MAKKTIEDIDVTDARVLMRVDFNVPLDDAGNITDDRRIRSALPSIRSVIDRGGRLILMSHLGRPEGVGPERGLDLRPVAERLGALLDGASVEFVPGDCAGPEAAAAAQTLASGAVLVLDNLRFQPGEKSGDPAFARALADLADAYCNDAFGTAHRKDASMVAVPEAMPRRPRVCGLLLRKEIRYLSEAIEQASGRPGFVAVLGGAKVSDKIGAIRNLAGRVDRILVGGAMAYTFLHARGVATGASRVEENMLDSAASILDEVASGSTELLLPDDHACGRELVAGTPVETFSGEIPDGWMGLDVGPATAARYAEVVRGASTIVWNGPMGVFEIPPFDAGSRAVAEAAAVATDGGAVSIVGGGDSAAAVDVLGLGERVSHVSTGGGASLRMLEGGSFPSVELLDDA